MFLLFFCLAPLAYEPFSTLAMIYEDQGDMEKSLQFELIAAHLNPSDTEEWVRLAEMSLEQDNIKQAIFCYAKGKMNECSALMYWNSIDGWLFTTYHLIF